MGNYNKEILIEHLAKIIYERMFDDSWHRVRMFGIEGDLYRAVARKVVEELERQKLLGGKA